MKVREGDLVETVEGLIFDVKGLIHPLNRVIAFVRYFPDKKGKRRRNGVTYGKVYSLSKRYALLKERSPQYYVYDPVFDEIICEVPVYDVRKHYDPIEKLLELRNSKDLDQLENKTLLLAELLKEKAGIPWNAIGISGSILAKLYTRKSDIDLIVYGSENCCKVFSALESVLKDEHKLIKSYNRESLKALFDFRSKDTMASFEDFVRTECRKVLQGKFMGTDYFVRFVKDWNEMHEEYGDIKYKNCGYAKIKATVVDDSESTFTPCRYKIENVRVTGGPKLEPVLEIESFRGRFCEQARKGEAVAAQGKIEQVIDSKQSREYFRILLGNKPTDFMILA